jgi:hypothetical protein
MREEREHSRGQILRPRLAEHLMDQLAMAQMNPVKGTDRELARI